jgi:hypothetical protein
MERRAFAVVIALAAAVLFMGPLPGRAQDAGTADPGYYPVKLNVGEAFDMCGSGQIACPARVAICDDPKVAVPVDLPGGLGFRGVSPGTTLCSAASAVGPRRVFRVTVR